MRVIKRAKIDVARFVWATVLRALKLKDILGCRIRGILPPPPSNLILLDASFSTITSIATLV
jgi:hypothetical protein